MWGSISLFSGENIKKWTADSDSWAQITYTDKFLGRFLKTAIFAVGGQFPGFPVKISKNGPHIRIPGPKLSIWASF